MHIHAAYVCNLKPSGYSEGIQKSRVDLLFDEVHLSIIWARSSHLDLGSLKRLLYKLYANMNREYKITIYIYDIMLPLTL